ncbi:MAG: hypothetical protein EHM42_04720 [Planctomycetaceae bacterium]|nr:MAG: hypothetical protein EHM42_04720 [Planctomycetaceae bacterium]
MQTETPDSEKRIVVLVRLRATDVTGRRRLQLDRINGYRTAGDVAMLIAGMMDLPATSRYSLRDSERARMLLDDDPLGLQIDESVTPELVVIPHTHLG